MKNREAFQELGKNPPPGEGRMIISFNPDTRFFNFKFRESGVSGKLSLSRARELAKFIFEKTEENDARNS